MSLSIDELSSLYGLNSVNGITQTNTQNMSSAEIEKKATDGDTYTSTIAQLDQTKAIPSENYNDLAMMIKSAMKASKNVNATEYATVNTTDYTSVNGLTAESESDSSAIEQTQAAGGTSGASGTSEAGGAGGAGGGSSDSEETETEIITIDGQTYIQTTTTDANGNTTVTREPIGAAPVENVQNPTSVENAQNVTPVQTSPGAEALASL